VTSPVSCHVFGPVPSRRLGRSLGVDLVPFKTCTYDCVYCQLGRTTDRTVTRRDYVPVDTVLADLRRTLATCTPDCVTISGSGEPTLHAYIGELVTIIKKETTLPVAVLTNGSLLWDSAVQDALLSADMVLPSLDAGDGEMFRHVNRPHPAISFDRMVEGLVEFRHRYGGALWLEVLLLGGMTALDAEVAKIAAVARRIRPDRVQLNTVTRPPAEDFAFAVPHADMQRFCHAFEGNCEMIADYHGPAGMEDTRACDRDVIELLRRRPCTVDDIAHGLGLHPTQAAKAVAHIRDEGGIAEERVGGRVYFSMERPTRDGKGGRQ